MNKSKERATNYNDRPLILDVSHIQQIMGISKVSAYGLSIWRGFSSWEAHKSIETGRCV